MGTSTNALFGYGIAFDTVQHIYSEGELAAGLKVLGVVLYDHCMGDCPMMLLAIESTFQVAYRGSPVKISFKEIDPEWKPKLDDAYALMRKAFQEEIGDEFEGPEAPEYSWFIASDWN